MIGIRLADGTYYPILDETRQAQKRLILSPANDQQQSVHIQFFRDDSADFNSPEFIGSVNLDNILPAPKDEKSIDLDISVDEDGNVNVSARDEQDGTERQITLNPHAPQSMDEGNLFAEEGISIGDDMELPEPGNFIGDKEDLQAMHEESAALGGLEEGAATSAESDGDIFEGDFESDFDWDEQGAASTDTVAREGMKPLLLSALVILAASGVVGLSFLVFKLLQGDLVPSINAMNGGMLRTIVASLTSLLGPGT